MDPAAAGPPRTTPAPLQTTGGTTHPSATQHMGRHARASTMDPLSGARRGTGTPAHPPHHPAARLHGLHRARSPGRGPLPTGSTGTASSGVTLPHTQAPTPRPSPSGTPTTYVGAGFPRPRSFAAHALRHGTDHHLQPPHPPLSMD